MSTFATLSGSVYETKTDNEGRLLARKVGRDTSFVKAIAVFPDRLPALEDTTNWEFVEGALIGRNKFGTRTAKLVPGQVRKGMLLWSPTGFRSTVIQRRIG